MGKPIGIHMMNQSGNSPKAYLRTKILTATPAELRLMLFDGALRFAEQGREGLQQKNYEQAYNGISRCQDIVLELINSLKPEHAPDLCEKLTALYTFIYTRLVSATTERNVEMLDEAVALLRYERETWQLVLNQLAQENASAGGMQQTPKPPHMNGAGDGSGNTSSLVGGKVSLRG
ncbi:MAG: flagellar export chaperone FliS [Phycisphaerales bacterium]|nr:MAG: flagellar export chaperone FliS [Phycisphaerales bacterium]